MSWEGYEQHICANGHYFENYDVTISFGEEEKPRCPHCYAISAWCNIVDQTNGPSQGKILYQDLKNHFLIEEAKFETCKACNHTERVSPDIFRIPTKKETDPLCKYYDE